MEMERQKGMIEFRMKPEFGKNEFCESDDDERKAKARQFIYLGHASKFNKIETS